MDERIDGIGSLVPGSDSVTPFLLASREGTLVAGGVEGVLTCARRDALSTCGAALMARPAHTATGSTPMIVGALPFSPSLPVQLYRPTWVKRSASDLGSVFARFSGSSRGGTAWQILAEPSRAEPSASERDW